MARKRFVVEFTGSPGAGKSTVASRCAELARARGLRVPEREAVRDLYLRHGWLGRLAGPQLAEREVAGQRLEYFKEVETPRLLRGFRLRHPRGWRGYRAALEEIRADDPDEAEVLERWVDQSILTWRMLRRRASRVDFFAWEEGIAHRALNLFVRPGRPLDEDAVRAFLRRWALPDALVWVQADTDACLSRMAARGLPERLVGHGPEAVRAFVESGARVSAAIAAEARRRGLPVLELENRQPDRAALLASGACEELLERLLAALA